MFWDRELPFAASVKARTLATTPLSCRVVPMSFALSLAWTSTTTAPLPLPL